MLAINLNPGRKQLRWFGVAAFLAFAVIGFLVHRWTGSAIVAGVLWGAGVATVVVGLPFPYAIRPLYVGLTVLTFPIGWVVSQILLRLIFYGVFTPIGLVFRLVGRDSLRLRRSTSDTYWRKRGEHPGASSYFRQT